MGAKINKQVRPRAVVVLFGELEFDGRAQRMVEMLKRVGMDITVIDIKRSQERSPGDTSATTRVRVKIPLKAGRMSPHLRLLKAALWHVWRIRPDVVVAEDFLTTGTAWLAAKIINARLVYDAHELIIPEKGSHYSRRDQFWYSMERWTVKQMDLAVAANKDRACVMAEHYMLKRIPTVMRNIPIDFPPSMSEEEVLKKYPALRKSERDEKLILYQGDVTLERGLGRFIEATLHLPKNYRIVVVGVGVDLEKIKEIGEALSQEGRFSALGRVPNRQLKAIAALADVGIVSYPFKGLNNIYCAPNKIFEYAQSGLPVVSTDQPSLRRMVETYKIGACVGEFDSVEQVAKVIQNVTAVGKASYATALNRFLADNRWEDEANEIIAEIKATLN